MTDAEVAEVSEASAPKKVGRPRKVQEETRAPVVTNLHKSTLVIAGVVIAPGASESVPDINLDKASIKRWIDKKVISVS